MPAVALLGSYLVNKHHKLHSWVSLMTFPLARCIYHGLWHIVLHCDCPYTMPMLVINGILGYTVIIWYFSMVAFRSFSTPQRQPQISHRCDLTLWGDLERDVGGWRTTEGANVLLLDLANHKQICNFLCLPFNLHPYIMVKLCAECILKLKTASCKRSSKVYFQALALSYGSLLDCGHHI